MRLDQLAHELKSLLDGSIRSLRHVRATLLGETVPSPGCVKRIEVVEQALRRMAEALSRAMEQPQAASQILNDSADLGAAARQTLALVADLAEERNVHLTASIAPQAAGLPAGPLAPAILNGLRNAIEACSGRDRIQPLAAPVDRVRLTIEVDDRNQLHIHIADSGPGIASGDPAQRTSKPNGHGLGLELCHQIAASLHGSLTLGSAPQGSAHRGALFHLSVPVRSLTRS
jgi:signal transduction histidine kinase